MTIKCYSQRLLNPFRGTLNTIEYNSAEAVSLDGVESNALTIEKQYLLYPKIIDQQFIKSALVEAIMRNNNTKIETEEVESVEYLELNNPTHHLNK